MLLGPRRTVSCIRWFSGSKGKVCTVIDDSLKSSTQTDVMDALTELRTTVLNWVLRVATPLGGIVVAVAIYDELRIHNITAALVYLLIYCMAAAVIWKPVPYAVRVCVCLLTLYGYGFAEVYYYEIPSNSLMLMLVFVTFSGIFFGFRIGMCSLALSAATLAAFGYLFTSGTIARDSVSNALPSDAFSWLTLCMPFVFFSFLGLVSVSILLRRLNQHVRKERKYVRDLHVEIEERERVEEALRRNDDALRENMERYRVLFNAGHDAVLVVENMLGRYPGFFSEVNDVACSRLEYTREELLHMTPMDIVVPDMISHVLEVMDLLQRNGHALWEVTNLTKSGKHIPVEVSSHRFAYGGKNAFFVCCPGHNKTQAHGRGAEAAGG